ncbi:MAG: hypothetical protein ABJC04_06945 [Verrucomicrobiota bacterium]
MSILWLTAGQASFAQENSFATFAIRAETKFKTAQANLLANPGNLNAALQVAITAFDWGEFAPNHEQRAKIADEGIAVCRQIIARQSNSAAGHYYLAMNLAELARTKSFGALKLLTEMEKEFLNARELDERIDYAGPDRNLGVLYNQAPGWPVSIGNRGKSRQFGQRAVTLAPNYPENHLNVMEACLDWGDKSGTRREFALLKDLWPKAKQEFTGEAWESSWADWEKRWKKIQSRYSESNRAIETPHNKK